MRTHPWLQLVICLSLLGHSAQSEPPDSASSASGNTTSRASPSEDPVFTPPAPIAAPQPVIPEQRDRSGNSGGAQAAAAAGAAMASAMCAMLMRQAMKETDPQQRQMLMMMAMQQCSQAAQSMQAANQNKDSKEKLTQNDTPKTPELPKGQALKAPEKPKESDLLKDLASKNSDEPLEVAELPPPPALPEAPAQNSAGGSSLLPTGNFPTSASVLDPIQNPNLTFKEDSKGGGVTPTAGPVGPAIISVAATKNLTAEELKALVEEQRNKGAEGRAVAATVANESAATSSTGGAAPSPLDVDGMLASLMGGGPGLETGAPSGNEILAFNPSNVSRENIFQYARFRYQRAAESEKRLQRNAKIESQLVLY